MDEYKSPWESKTLIAAAIMAIAPLFPPAAALIAANPGLSGAVAGLITAILRVTTTKKIGLP